MCSATMLHQYFHTHNVIISTRRGGGIFEIEKGEVSALHKLQDYYQLCRAHSIQTKLNTWQHLST